MNTRCFIIVIYCCVLLLSLPLSHAEERTWTNKNGKTLKGELIEKKKSTLIIKKGETEVTVKIDDLSDADKEWLDELVPYDGFEYGYKDVKHRTTKTITKYGTKRTTVQTPYGNVNFMNSRARPVAKTKVPVVTERLHFFVLSVDEDSPAAGAGIEAGTIITKINGKAFKTVEEYETWDNETTSPIRSYLCETPKEDGKILKKTVRIVPEWKTPEEMVEIVKANNAAEIALQGMDWEVAGGEFKTAVVEFVKPDPEDFSRKEMELGENDKDTFIVFAQDRVKSGLKFKYDAIFNDDVNVKKMSLDLPDDKILIWWVVEGTVKVPSASGVFLTHEYGVLCVNEDDSPKAVYAKIGDKVLLVSPSFANQLRKREEHIKAVVSYMLYIQDEEKYDDSDYTPDFDAVDEAVLIHVKKLFLDTQKIGLRMWIKPEYRTPKDQLTVRYLGNHAPSHSFRTHRTTL